jgi:putative nucleotidyltransferase with HDIG domain
MKIEKTKETLSRQFGLSRHFREGLLIGVTVIFILLVYPNIFIPKHSYTLGDVAERDIKAPIDLLIEDETATEANRRQAEENVLTIYDYDPKLSSKLRNAVKQVFDELRAVFEGDIQNESQKSDQKAEIDATVTVEDATPFVEKIWQKKKDFEDKIGISVSNGAYKILVKERFSENIANFINGILTKIFENGVVANKEILLRETDKGIVLRAVGTKAESVVRNLKQFYGLDQAKTMVRIIGQPLLKDMNYNLHNLIVDFAQRLIHPNITLNLNETTERKKKAAAEIKPVLHQIKAGEMLLREGERVTQVKLLKLKALDSQSKKEQILASSTGLALLMLSLLLITFILHLKDKSHMADGLNKNLLFMATVLIIFIFLTTISASLSESLTHNAPFSISASSLSYGIPLASGAMIICLFLGLETALPFALVMAVCSGFIFQNRFEIFIYFLLNSTMAAYWIQNCRERKVFIKAGAKLGALNMILATAITIFSADFSGPELLWDWAFAFMGGIGAAIVTVGIAPLLEVAFDYKTDIALLELANLDQPILRRLMLEAPGTYHHSVIVGSLVEAAASEIGANPLLAKVCGYYHDIGKIKKPLYFIENQTNGKNKHDKLSPSMSRRILIAHIKDGVEIAKQNRLGRVIIETIRQSHGTSLISYFYEKAKQMKGEEVVNIDDFRYPGPRPQTREAGLVMLADVVEAASRTLENPTPSRIQGLVQHLINKVFSDGQLDNCELTLKDLHNIAKSFNKILNGIHHHRIEYSETPALISGKGKDGSSVRQRTKQIRDISAKNSAKGAGHLRRLGQS